MQSVNLTNGRGGGHAGAFYGGLKRLSRRPDVFKLMNWQFHKYYADRARCGPRQRSATPDRRRCRFVSTNSRPGTGHFSRNDTGSTVEVRPSSPRGFGYPPHDRLVCPDRRVGDAEPQPAGRQPAGLTHSLHSADAVPRRSSRCPARTREHGLAAVSWRRPLTGHPGGEGRMTCVQSVPDR